jgi:hypothetical protein
MKKTLLQKKSFRGHERKNSRSTNQSNHNKKHMTFMYANHDNNHHNEIIKSPRKLAATSMFRSTCGSRKKVKNYADINI